MSSYILTCVKCKIGQRDNAHARTSIINHRYAADKLLTSRIAQLCVIDVLSVAACRRTWRALFRFNQEDIRSRKEKALLASPPMLGAAPRFFARTDSLSKLLAR
jgi:hypothetical protein